VVPHRLDMLAQGGVALGAVFQAAAALVGHQRYLGIDDDVPAFRQPHDHVRPEQPLVPVAEAVLGLVFDAFPEA
jgi:hypothetical protein